MSTPSLPPLPRPVVAAVSGGADSLALLYWLVEGGERPLVAHFNHQLRPSAQAEANFVRQTAQTLGLAYFEGTADAGAWAAQQHLSVEEAARELRYRFLFQTARAQNATAVLTGHTADDQAETLLMHFLRGAALPGLKGMSARTLLKSFDPSLPLLRPLLAWSRAQTEAFCRERGLHFQTDESNADPAYLRNRLRHELLPLLETYNPNLRQTLNKTARVLQEEEALLEEVENQAWDKISLAQSAFVRLEKQALQNLAPALRRRLLRRAAFWLRPALRDVDFDTLQRAAALQAGPLCGGLHLFVEGEYCYLAFSAADLPVEAPQVEEGEGALPLQPGAPPLRLGPGWQLSAALEAFTWPGQGVRQLPEAGLQSAIRVDAQQLGAALWVRAPRQGDRLEGLGMPGSRIKLSDLFINLKIPRRLRQRWPLVCVGEQIVWVAGLRMGHAFRLREESCQALCLSLEKV